MTAALSISRGWSFSSILISQTVSPCVKVMRQDQAASAEMELGCIRVVLGNDGHPAAALQYGWVR